MSGAARAPSRLDDVVRGIWRENPVLVTTLGLCPTLAVTNTVANCVAMGLATLFVLVGANFLVSAAARFIPNEVRISGYVLIIATFVTVADLSIEALAPAVHKDLGAFIALIVVNCIILGRQEAFAAKNPPLRAALDALGSGIGFLLVLLAMGTVRETLGNGTFLGRSVFGPRWEPWVVLMLPPGGFLTLGTFLIAIRFAKARRAARARAAAEHAAAAAPAATPAGSAASGLAGGGA
jgi:electron transport complex protein RnfE